MLEGQTTPRPGATDPAVASAVRRVVRSWRFRGWIAGELAFALVLIQLPLFGVLGYELALASALLGSIVSLHVGVSVASAARGVPGPALARARDPGRIVLALAARAIALAAAITALPALVAALNGLRAATCDWAFGVRAYASMVTTSAVVFAGAGVAIGLVAGRAWARLVLGVGLIVALALAALWRFYSEPAVFSYSALIGYFPGNLYDEHVRVGAPLYWARLEQLAWVIVALAGVAALLDGPTLRPRLRERRPATVRAPALLVATLAASGALVLHLLSGSLGYAIDAEDIQGELGGRIETDHFVIYYAERPEVIADLELIADDHELRLAQVAATLGLDEDDLQRMGKIRSYYFASRAQKGRLMGAHNVEMAKPWRREIYLTHEEFPHHSLRHEIAHVVAGSFGDPVFGVAARRIAGVPALVNPGLVEGLAVAVDWPGHARSLTPHQAVRAMQEMGVQPAVRDVFSLGFLSLSSARSYTTAGSFVRFLLDTYGPDAIRRLYATGGDFEKVYGEDLATLEAAWRDMLADVPLTPEEVEIVRERFRHPGVFARRCPHAVAARRDDAVAAAIRGDRGGAIRALRSVCRDSGGEPRYRLDLADQLALGAPDEHAEALAIYEEIAGDVERMTSTLRADALERLAHLAAIDGDWAAAEARIAEAAALPLEDGAARLLEAKLIALRHHGPAGPALRAYFFGGAAGGAPDDAGGAATSAPRGIDQLEQAARATAFEPTLGLAWYLRGLQHVIRGEHAAAVIELGIALDLPLPSRRFVRNAARRLAISAWRVGDRDAVARAAEALAGPGHTEMDLALAQDWRDRLAWSAERPQARLTSR